MVFSNFMLAQDTVHYHITTQEKNKKFNSLLLGSNISWSDEGDGLFDPIRQTFREPAITYVKNMALRVMRFPGGTLSENYQWKGAIGTLKERKKGIHLDGLPQTMIFGSDEFLNLCKSENYIPIITLPSRIEEYGNDLEWIKYCNGLTENKFGELQKENRQPTSLKVQYWEIGNEVYLSGGNVEHAQQYMVNALRLAKGIKSIDSQLSIGVVITGNNRKWDSTVIAMADSTIDFLSYHAYFVSSGDMSHELNSALKDIQSEIINISTLIHVLNQRLRIAVTEYNLLPSNGKTFENRKSDMTQAVYLLGCIALFQKYEILLATKWTLASPGNIYFADIQKSYTKFPLLTPSYIFQKEFNTRHLEYCITGEINSEDFISITLTDEKKSKVQVWIGNTHWSKPIVCTVSVNLNKPAKTYSVYTLGPSDRLFHRTKAAMDSSARFIVNPLSITYVNIE